MSILFCSFCMFSSILGHERLTPLLPLWNVDRNVIDLVAVATSAPLPRTGQITVNSSGDDGSLQKGVAWPNPRFTDNQDGTITDHLTGLIWLQNGTCAPNLSWEQAIQFCQTLSDGTCGLTDGSSQGDWRLPSVLELQSLNDFEYIQPSLCDTQGTGPWSPGDPFIMPELFYFFFWSSTVDFQLPGGSWVVDAFDGTIYSILK